MIWIIAAVAAWRWGWKGAVLAFAAVWVAELLWMCVRVGQIRANRRKAAQR